MIKQVTQIGWLTFPQCLCYDYDIARILNSLLRVPDHCIIELAQSDHGIRERVITASGVMLIGVISHPTR
jgi:hypothetical protein